MNPFEKIGILSYDKAVFEFQRQVGFIFCA